MSNRSEKGVTLVELLLVVVIAGLIASVAVPSLIKGRQAANAAVAVGQLRLMHINQSLFRAQRSRYARLSELNSFANNTHGRTVGSSLQHKDFTFIMFPTPSAASLRREFNIIGYRIENGRIASHYTLTHEGLINTIIP
jgi:prepilin-type N-terminal cleavage/methylation domain-containing protein